MQVLCPICRRKRTESTSDEGDNILIWKEASPGYEDREPVVLQGHLDMVCEKTADSGHDFTKDALDLYVETDLSRREIRPLAATMGLPWQ